MPSKQYPVGLPVASYGDGVAGLEVHPEAETLVLRLEADVRMRAVESEVRVDHWRAQLVYPGPEIGYDLDRDGFFADLVLAHGKFAVLVLENCGLEGTNPLNILDAEGPELAAFAEFFAGGSFAEDIDVDEPPRGLVIVDKIWVPGPFRGRRFGLLLTAAVLRELIPDRLAVCMPFDFEVSPLSSERDAADARSRRLSERFGFRPYRGGLFYLDPDMGVVEEKIELFSREIDAAPAITLP